MKQGRNGRVQLRSKGTILPKETTLIRFACLTVLIASSAWAANTKACDRFVKAFQKAGKASKASPDAKTVNFMKQRCTSKSDAEVKKDTECLEKVKNSDDLEGCMR